MSNFSNTIAELISLPSVNPLLLGGMGYGLFDAYDTLKNGVSLNVDDFAPKTNEHPTPYWQEKPSEIKPIVLTPRQERFLQEMNEEMRKHRCW